MVGACIRGKGGERVGHGRVSLWLGGLGGKARFALTFWSLTVLGTLVLYLAFSFHTFIAWGLARLGLNLGFQQNISAADLYFNLAEHGVRELSIQEVSMASRWVSKVTS